MKIWEANVIVGGFSEPSKMPCYSWSISAMRCKVGAVMAAVVGSICSTCYAMKGRYVFDVVQNAMQRRYGQWKLTVTDAAHRAAFIEAFKTRLANQDHFRWFDSGDLQSHEMLTLIIDIARATPWCDHWLPTREYRLLRTYFNGRDWADVLPPNLNIRVSAHMINENAPVVLGFSRSAVFDKGRKALKSDGFKCGAYTRGGKCGPCRACWDRSVETVIYPKH